VTKKPLLAICFALSTTCVQHVSAAQDKPNIVLMVMDNLGWGEIGIYGGGILRGAETPHLDTLAG
jgi:arylsulfatase